MIFGVLKVVNFSHGAFYMFGAYFAMTTYQYTGSFALAMLAGAIGTAIIGATLVFGLGTVASQLEERGVPAEQAQQIAAGEIEVAAGAALLVHAGAGGVGYGGRMAPGSHSPPAARGSGGRRPRLHWPAEESALNKQDPALPEFWERRFREGTTPWDAFTAAIAAEADFMALTEHYSTSNAYEAWTMDELEWANLKAAAAHFTSSSFVAFAFAIGFCNSSNDSLM